ncbi:acid protease [Russula emetica]|nr:acid protease [Russula emetica]
MQLTPSFILILGVVFRITLDAYAIPLTREQKGVVTLPLKRTPMRRDIHPLMLFQMRNARAQRRLARMTGRAIPSANEIDRLTARHTTRIGYAGSKLNNNGLNVPSTGVSEIAAADSTADTSNGVSSLDVEAAEKNTLTPANTPTTPNSLGLNIDADDVSYIATVQMGTPPRNFNLLMDSGSADLWVGSEGCKSVTGGDCGNHTFLGPQSSSSFVDSQKQFEVTYGKGAVQGDIIKDNLVVAGLNLPNHTFGVATEETEDFSGDTTLFDGIMGLAKSTLSEQKTLTPSESLAQTGQIKQAIVSFKLSRLADQKNDGEVTFGGLDASKFDQNTLVTLNDVSNQGFWEAAMDAVSVDGNDLGLNNRTAILDTGTTLLIVPTSDALAIHKSIPGAKEIGNGTFTVPCTTKSSLALTFGKQAFAIDPRDIAISPVDPNNLAGDCLSGVTAGQVGGANEWLAGDVFLKNAYFSTNVEQNTIQLAKLT